MKDNKGEGKQLGKNARVQHKDKINLICFITEEIIFF